MTHDSLLKDRYCGTPVHIYYKPTCQYRDSLYIYLFFFFFCQLISPFRVFEWKGLGFYPFPQHFCIAGDEISSHQVHDDKSAFAGAASSRFASFGKGFSLLPSVLSNGILNPDDAASANVWATLFQLQIKGDYFHFDQG